MSPASVSNGRRLRAGPRIVAIGGGTGVSTLLRGLKRRTGNLTAIVTVADDGGSSGRLREELGIPPPGDARRCLAALSEAGPLVDELLDYRFNGSSGLSGHSLGNLLLAALYDKHGGFQEGLDAAARLLGVSGRVVPVSNAPGLTLMGETTSGETLRGESAVSSAAESLRRLWLEPEGAAASEAALAAIRQADLIVIGPGSLYTSILPNFLVHGIGEAVAASQAPSVLVCNVATERYETDGFNAADHLRAFQAHSGVSVSHFLVNGKAAAAPGEWSGSPVAPVAEVEGYRGVVVSADVIDDERPALHDPHRLADALTSLVPAARAANAGREG